MTASRVRADYDELQEIAQAFARQSEAVRQSYGVVLQAKDTLQGGDWVGKGADKFYQEMNSSILPSLKRLAQALERASETTKKISQIMKQAEQDASHVFKEGEPSAAHAAVMPPGYREVGGTTGASGTAAGAGTNGGTQVAASQEQGMGWLTDEGTGDGEGDEGVVDDLDAAQDSVDDEGGDDSVDESDGDESA